jgi:predicted O-methyltransferase YrrM
MSQDQWTAVDRYLGEHLCAPDPILTAALESSAAAGLPAINVSPMQGKLLHLLARTHGSRNILEIGTLAGYSTIWLARALPAGGRLVTLELDPRHAAVARENFARAGLEQVIELRVGAALDTLARLGEEGRGPFDLVFIDADKERLAEYFDWSVKLARPGSVIVVDNVVRKGAVLDPSSSDARVQGVRRMYQQLAADGRVSATAIQTVGSKGYDGFVLAVVG